MKIMTCPLNGPRNITEFAYGGEVHDRPDPPAAEAEGLAHHLWFHANRPAVTREWWCHTPTNTWFMAERDRARDLVLATYLPDDPRAKENS